MKNGPLYSSGFLGWVSHLVAAHRRRLASIARTEGLGQEDALDAVQEAFETFLLLPQARELVENEEESAKLLTVIVKNEARNQRRKSRRRGRFYVDDSGLAYDLPGKQEDQESLILAAEEHISFLGCLRKLKEMQQQVITLRLLDGIDGGEVADVLGIKPGNVATILNRAKVALRECLVG